ncbi:hypothetical protein EDF46_1560 [Frondihabitans sp. PhB188]|uniref:hypothetical protein n=1 Tax=Frondihabitans sp. PhB188 TaxID=2485200 RepID=UPI000F47F9D6|nr:hypothetical protein [Frondihabitans sp. PhB188]ROQ39925.1 hypothetical protein EDF46_1560 [Frondihabitans sp. PhB188]
MNLTLEAVGLGDGPGAPLPAISAAASTRVPGVVAVETEGAPTLASLIAGGRMRPDTGRVLIDGVDDAARIRETFALVDTPTVAEPFADLMVRTVVQEDLALAGLRGNADSARDFLDTVGLAEHDETRLKNLPTEARVRLLSELAALRPGVKGLIITSPERHGGDTERWFRVVEDLSARGFTVLLVTGVAAALHVNQLLPALEEPTEQLPVDDGVDANPAV